MNSIQNQDHISILLEQDMLEEILILASKDYQPVNEFAEVSSKFISMEEADKLPGGFNDIGRMAQNFSGVQKTMIPPMKLLCGVIILVPYFGALRESTCPIPTILQNSGHLAGL
jgi:hypothetical protein